MCDFNNLDDEAKALYQSELMKVVETLGSKNAFLQLIEEVRKSKPHPLVSKNLKFSFSRGEVRWNKVIFQDKLALLLKMRLDESERKNFLLEGDNKEAKKVLNLVRTLAPIKFIIRPKSGSNSYELKAFIQLDEKTTILNPVFDIIFFCAIDGTKRILTTEEE